MDLACKTLEKIFGIEITNADLFRKALTHTSFAKENKTNEHYERLEFLGDAVLKLCVSDILYTMFPDYPEGNLTKIRSIVVSDKSLSVLSEKLGVDKLMILGKQEEKTGGRKKTSIKACAFEAILGAYYLDGKYLQIEKFLKNEFSTLIVDVDKNFEKFNSKNILQEYTQSQNKMIPEYELVSESGPEHDKVFCVRVVYNEKVLATGSGKTKKEAEQQAAFKACQSLNIIKE